MQGDDLVVAAVRCVRQRVVTDQSQERKAKDMGDLIEHTREERIMCRAHSLGKIATRHQFGNAVRKVTLRCTKQRHPSTEPHIDGACCWRPHHFDSSMADMPRNADESVCRECGTRWPCDVEVNRLVAVSLQNMLDDEGVPS